jgi:hypothetical protein
MALFICASLSWAFFFVTDLLTVWAAMGILVMHGFAGVFWQTPNQLLLQSMVKPADLPSAVRLNAVARTLGVLVGPAVGSVIMLALGPSKGIMLNTIFYLPMLLWLFRAPGQSVQNGAHRAVRGFADIVGTIRAIAPSHILTSMTLLAGVTSFLLGNAYGAQMPAFAADLGHGDPGLYYSLLLAADAAGALTGGFVLEAWGRLPMTPRNAIAIAGVWACALTGFAASPHFAPALVFLFVAGFCELAFNTMAQALVQINAPVESRGRVLGLYNMGSLGMRAFSGIWVGLLGAWTGVHWSLALSGLAVLAALAGLALKLRSAPRRKGAQASGEPAP